jgi:hypothetical protein
VHRRLNPRVTAPTVAQRHAKPHAKLARQRENVFIEGVHRHLPGSVYAEKMHNPFRRGTPDCYYEGPQGILWAEYKWLKALPDVLVCTNIKDFTKLQQRWLRRAHNNGVSVALIVGSLDGAVVCPALTWAQPLKPSPLPSKEVARWISDFLTISTT